MRTQNLLHIVRGTGQWFQRLAGPRGIGLAALAAVLVGPAVCFADLIFLKDGFTLHGKLRQQGETITDSVTKDQFWMPKGNFVVDDDARRIYFSTRQVEDVDNRFLNEGADIVYLQRSPVRVIALQMSPVVKIQEIAAWDDRWERSFKHLTDQGPLKIQQRLNLLTPHFARVDAVRYAWSSFYLTSELGPDTVRSLFLHQPGDLMDKNKKIDAAQRFRIYRFFVQAGWLDAAESELGAILRDMPDQRQKADFFREGLQKLRAQQLLTEIERAHKAGRHRWAQEQLAIFPRQKTDDRLLVRLRLLQAKYESANENLTLAQRFLKELPPLLPATPPSKMFAAAAATILQELNLDNADRLEPFVSFGRLADRDRQLGRTPAQGPAELVALAISGWLQGTNSAETSLDMAQRLWTARRFVLEYQRTAGVDARQRLLEAYQTQTGLAFDELSQLIRFLPPPEAEEKLTPGPMDLQVTLPGGRQRGTKYQAALPPDYHHGRSYPVLIALHQAGEAPSEMLLRWSELAGKNGYIVAAPAWEQGTRGFYGYSAEEHAVVLDVLRDLRRRFQVDSDRVFLTGFGEGGSMAYDVGLSHPDLFAGVLPMSARPQFFAAGPYWRNAQYLPFYVVTGDHGYANVKVNTNRRLFDQWIPRGYMSLYVEYKGRGLEWFDGELPYMIDWMNRKKRARAVPELGRNPNTGASSEEFQTMRANDDRFYWLSTESINDRNLNDASSWKINTVPATMQARIHENNQIHIHVRGIKQLTVWLGPDMLIDFDKPVILRINQFSTWNNGNRPLKPSLRTLLEDLYQRGDRQRLFLVEIPLDQKMLK